MEDNYAVSRGEIGTSDPVGPVPALDDTSGAADDDEPEAAATDGGQGLTLVHFPAQRKHILLDTLGA
jgi:hypothetical protein